MSVKLLRVFSAATVLCMLVAMHATSSTHGAPVNETSTAPPETVATEGLTQPPKEGEEEEEVSVVTNTTETGTSRQAVTEIAEELKTLTKTAANSAYLTYDYIVSHYIDKLASVQ